MKITRKSAWIIIVSSVLLIIVSLGLMLRSLGPVYELAGRCPESPCPEHEAALQRAETHVKRWQLAGGAGFVVMVGGILLLRKAERKVEDANIHKPKQLY